MLLLGACSDDKDPVRPVPNDPIETVLPVPDDVTVNAPAQTDYSYDAFTKLNIFSFENGQVLYLERPVNGPNLILRKVGGTASDVVIPATVVAGENTYNILGIGLYVDGMADNVKTLTLSKATYGTYASNKFTAITASEMRVFVEKLNNVEKLELENGYPGFCSVNGAIYNTAMTALVAVPRAKDGTFTVADGVTAIQDRAFYYCQKLDVVTLPGSVESIGDEAFLFTNDILLVNCLPATAPAANPSAFGYYTRKGTIRIPNGSYDSYIVPKPEIEKPVEPVDPGMDSSDEEYDAYLKALGEYNKAMELYNEEMKAYTDAEAYSLFEHVEQVNF